MNRVLQHWKHNGGEGNLLIHEDLYHTARFTLYSHTCQQRLDEGEHTQALVVVGTFLGSDRNSDTTERHIKHCKYQQRGS